MKKALFVLLVFSLLVSFGAAKAEWYDSEEECKAALAKIKSRSLATTKEEVCQFDYERFLESCSPRSKCLPQAEKQKEKCLASFAAACRKAEGPFYSQCRKIKIVYASLFCKGRMLDAHSISPRSKWYLERRKFCLDYNKKQCEKYLRENAAKESTGKKGKPEKKAKRVKNKGCNGGFSDGKCGWGENCRSCPQDCACPAGMKCDLCKKANFRGCVAVAAQIKNLLKEYKENQLKYQQLKLYWKRMARLYRANLIKKMMKFVLFDVPTPTPKTVGDLIVDVVGKIQERLFYQKKMSDEEILTAQRKYLDSLKQEMRRLILENRKLRDKIAKLKI